MLETFNIQSESGSYGVSIGSHILVDGLESEAHKCFKLIDDKVDKLWPLVCQETGLKVFAVEQNKTLEQVAHLIEALRGLGANRNSYLYAFGGGIVQDLATFVASSYMRGIPWTYCPTTLLGMVDSCIGGKSSLNVGIYKNIAGNFYPPKKILIDIAFCQTLTIQEKIAGLCEAIKICFASPSSALEDCIDIFDGKMEALSEKQLFDIVSLSLATKKTFIEEDEFDQGIRLLLNFGHTFGHAIEAATHFSVTHGVAVGVGMLAEIELSILRGVDLDKCDRVEKLKTYLYGLFKNLPDLKNQLSTLSVADAVASFRSDKKHTTDKYYLILVDSQGGLERQGLLINPELEFQIETIFSNIKKGLLF